MNTSELLYQILEYAKKSFPYDDLVIDLANNPFFAISIIGEDRCISQCGYITPKHEHHSSKYSTATNFALSQVLQSTCLGQNQPSVTEYGYCDKVLLEKYLILISVVASPDDARFIFQTLKKQVEILSYQEHL